MTTDYWAVLLTGFSTGMGVIMAQELWAWIKKNRIHKLPMDLAENMVDDIKKDIGTRRRRR